jgi:hypothetical protein
LRQVLLDGLEDVVRFDKTFTHYELRGDRANATRCCAAGMQVGVDEGDAKLHRMLIQAL